jgi:hypothetical protein
VPELVIGPPRKAIPIAHHVTPEIPMAPAIKLRTIYVYLPNEAVAVWAPVDAEHVDGDVYRIVDCRAENEEGEFGKGALVRCQLKMLGEGANADELTLVAVALAN